MLEDYLDAEAAMVEANCEVDLTMSERGPARAASPALQRGP